MIIDEWWKMYGFGPTVDDIMRMTGERSRSNTVRKMKALVAIGVCKATPKRARSIRPVGIRVRSVE